MLKRDFIMVLIEELGKVIAQLATNRDHGATRKNANLIQEAYTSLKIDGPFLLSTTPEEIRAHLDKEDGTGLQRMELAAKILLEEGHLYPSRKKEIREKALLILEYIQAHDTTFSLERMAILEGLRDEFRK